MGLFDRFRNRNSDNVLPSEVDAYYKSEQKNRRGKSVLFAILALIITLAIAVGLFYGGRAIYRLFQDDSSTIKPIEDFSQSQNTNDPQNATKDDNLPGSEGSSSNPSSSSGGSSSDSEDQPDKRKKRPSTTTIPATGDSPETLPSTGD